MCCANSLYLKTSLMSPHLSTIYRKVELQQELIIDAQDRCELLRSCLPYGPLAVFHLRDVALGNPSPLGELALGHPFLGAGSSQHAARPLSIGDWPECLTPGDRLTDFLKSQVV